MSIRVIAQDKDETRATAGVGAPRTGAVPLASMAALLATPGFLRLSLGNGLSIAGLRLQSIAVAWLVLEMTGSRMWLGIVNGLPSFVVICFSLLGGAIADSRQPGRALRWARAAMAVATFAAAALVSAGHADVLVLIAVVMVTIAATSIDMPVGRTLVFQAVGPARVLSGSAMSAVVLNVCNIAGPLALGLAIGRFGVDVALYGVCAVYVAAMLLAPARRAAAGPSAPGAGPLATVRDGLLYVRATPLVASLVSLAFLVPLASVFFAMAPVYARDVLHVGAGGLGLMMSAFGIGSLAGSLYQMAGGSVGRKGPAVCVLGLVFSGGMIAFALSTSLLVSCGVAFVMGTSAMLWQNTLSGTIQTIAAPEMRGRALAVYTMGFQLNSLGWLVGGVLATLAGPVGALVLSGLAFASVSVVIFARSRELLAVR